MQRNASVLDSVLYELFEGLNSRLSRRSGIEVCQYSDKDYRTVDWTWTRCVRECVVLMSVLIDYVEGRRMSQLYNGRHNGT